MELLILTRLAIACVTAVFGNAFSKWFLNTKAGAWFQKKLDSVMEFLQKRYDIEIASREEKWLAQYPLLAKRIVTLEKEVKKLKAESKQFK